MAIAPEGTLTAPAGAGPDSDMLVARPAMMPGPAGISALRTTERVAGSIVDPTAVTRPAMSGSINTVMPGRAVPTSRSEEHTSELQSLMRISYAVFCLKKKKHQTTKQ